MKKLPLYEPEKIGSALNAVEPIAVSRGTCERCELPKASRPRTVCMPAEQVGDGGRLLIVSEYPGRDEDLDGRPMRGVSGQYLRKLLKEWGVSNYVLDNALKCAPGRTKVSPKFVDACRPYAAGVAAELRPTRIVLLGGTALLGVLGRNPGVLSIRKGWAWHRTEDGLVPVFFTMNPAAATRNRFYRKAFEDDLRWALTVPPPTPLFDASTFLVEDEADALEAEEDLRSYAWSAYDVETHGLMHDSDFRIECVTFAPVGKLHAWTFGRESLRDPKVRVVVKRVVEELDLVTANGKYDDRSMLLDLGASARESFGDVRLMSRMLDPGAAADVRVIAERVGLGGHKRDMKEHTRVVTDELQRQARPKSPTTPKGNPRKVKPPLFEVPKEVLAKIAAGADPKAYMYGYADATRTYVYNAIDAHGTRAYGERALPEFRANPEASRVWEGVVRGANNAIRMIEHWGIGADRAAIDQFAAYCKERIVEARRMLDAVAGAEFNPNSPVQVGELLFGRLGLRRVKETETGADSTDAEVLEALSGEHEVVDALLMHRKWSKLDGTYATGMIPHVREDGRIHCSYLLDGAATGRLSCMEPNLQNLPRAKGTPDARMSRNCFVARKGFVILESDFSQLELRVAALLANDRVMIEDFKRGIDIHMAMTEQLYELVFKITPEQWAALPAKDTDSTRGRDYYRSIVKNAFVFGGFYGKTTNTLSRELGCSIRQVETIFDRIWGRYKAVAAWRDEQKKFASRNGGVWTYWGGERARWRPLWGVADPDDGRRIHALNGAVNTPCQGTGADYMTASLWPTCRWIAAEKFPAKLVATVHDSLLLEVRRDLVAEAAGKVKEIMQSHYSGDVPLDVDQVYGEAWGSLSEKIAPAKPEKREIEGGRNA